MEQGTVGLVVEAFDVEDTAVAGLAEDGDTAVAGVFAHQHLRGERVALLHDDVEAVEERLHRRRVHGGGEYLDTHVRVDLGDPACRDHGLVDADVEHGRGHTVEVPQVELVEVGQSQGPRQSFQRDRVGDGVSDAEPDHTDDRGRRPVLLGEGDLVAVAVETHPAERTRAQHVHDGSPPRHVDPAGCLVQDRVVGSGQAAPQRLPLALDGVDDGGRGIRAQCRQPLCVCRICRVEDLDDGRRGEGVRCHGIASSVDSLFNGGRGCRGRLRFIGS